MLYSGMRINIPSKKETITFFHVKPDSIVMFHRRLSRYFSRCFELGSSFPLTHLWPTVTGWNEISYTKRAGFLLSTKWAPPRNCTTDFHDKFHPTQLKCHSAFYFKCFIWPAGFIWLLTRSGTTAFFFHLALILVNLAPSECLNCWEESKSQQAHNWIWVPSAHHFISSCSLLTIA